MLISDILLEMLVRYRAGSSDYVIAFQDSIWVLDDQTPANVFRDVKRRTGLRGKDAHEMMSDARDHRPDVLVGHIYHDKLLIDGHISVALNPRSSLLIKKVVQQLNLSGVTAERLGNEDEFEETFEVPDLEGRIPDVVFHGTSTAYMDKIMRIGIAPNENSNWANVGKFHNKVYLTAGFDDAAAHARNTADNTKSYPVVIAARIPDRTKITLDYDVGATIHGINPAMDREGYSASVRRDQDKWEKAQVKRIGKYDKGTDYTREIGIFGYRGRIPSSFFNAVFMPESSDEPLTSEHAVEVTNRDEMWRALDRLENFGYYDPSDPDDDLDDD